MPKNPITRPSTRPLFISHAAADKDLVNFFIDTILIRGIGVSQEAIFNTSATSGPIAPGSNFTEDIRHALREAEFIIAVITPLYFQRAFTMAELGAAWAFERLIPILVPPLDFADAEGILKGTQCLKIDNKSNLSSIYDQLAKAAHRRKSWISPSGHGTFEEQRDTFLNGLQARINTTTNPPPPTSTPQIATKTASKPQTPEEARQEFKARILDLKAALALLPPIVRQAFFCKTTATGGLKLPSGDVELADALHRGLVTTSQYSNGFIITKEVLVYPSENSQLNKDVDDLLIKLTVFIGRAPPAFRRDYENSHGHPADLRVARFWNTHNLRGLAPQTP
ncbi:toll/interleukin-1 receptor domain-containing protein [Myxococcus sp. K15C18031901]|uniref:toll/interleukin-1 receptor domain-containing protein n=1 Tax=Myxococcus dinghuensis TaxID=2906761 RepID=UPI0020A80B23|nr:toll/interleukin-1 receptor domain-containing protein [Myxococcus dinghuensis]MCP3098998.1 toll/interleukin-1 receptor domain-containing protein [Myxococcus dinghuensis]